MAIFKHTGPRITAMAAAVPKNIYNNLTDNEHFTKEDAEMIVDKIGITERRIASSETCASDLAVAACRSLFEKTMIDINSIDVLIFVTQTPDYRMPATGITIQHRLGLSKQCAAFDINLGCSGFVYGLNMAYSFVKQDSIRRVLLINAETRSKVYSFKDRQTGFLFGDAASAFIIENSNLDIRSVFQLDSDGSKAHYIMVKSGGYRYPSNENSYIEKLQDDGSFHSDEQGYMIGPRVFEFVITEVPGHIRGVIKISESDREGIDFFVLHQANKFMNDHLVKKLALDPQKVPTNLNKFGNTSSVSIPLTLVSELKDKLKGKKKLLISGFGVGLSLATALIETESPQVLDLVEL